MEFKNICHRSSSFEGFKISSLNVCGLVSKLDYLEHSDILEDTDFIVLTETKCDVTSETVVIDFFNKQGYEIIFKHRKKFSTFKSGGIALCIKKIYIIDVKSFIQNVLMCYGVK